MRPARAEVAAFAALLAVAALVALALVWSAPAAYAALGGADDPARRAEHAGWVAYVTGRAPAQPPGPFTADERRHMADVRGVFAGAQAAAALSLALLAALAWRARARGTLARLARDGAVASAAGVAALGAFAALAFDVAFRLFHEVLFPQGNWAFPSDSALLAVYPAAYFRSIALAIAVSFVALTAVVAVLAAARVRIIRRG